MSRRLAEVGVVGHQLDVADGGDVDPVTGRLLSIAELQQALRLVRRRPLPATMPTLSGSPTDPAEPTPQRTSAAPAPDLNNLYLDDPYLAALPADLDDFGDDDPDFDDEASGDSVGSWRRASGRRRRPPKPAKANNSTRSEEGRAAKPRSAAVRAIRVVLGVDRGPKGAADPDTQVGSGDTRLVAAGESVGAAARRAGRSGGDDFEVTPAPRGFAAIFWRWTARALLLVLIAAGVNQLFVKPLRSPSQVTSAPTSGMDPAAAGQLAARYATDYLSYVPGTAAANRASLAQDMAPGADISPTSTQLFAGSGYLRADLAAPGQVTAVDAAHVVVSVAVRIHLATPPAPTDRSTADPAIATAPSTDPADPARGLGAAPAGWRDLGGRWIGVAVPVESTSAGLRVSAGGAVFTGEPPAQVSPASGGGRSAVVTAATAGLATAFFTGYAGSDVSYLAQPGASLSGLSGAVRLVSLTDWAVTTGPTATGGGAAGASPAAGTGVGAVTWQLTGTDLRVMQRYAVALSSSQGRWYVAALSPISSITDQ